jgi:hypothetical protein
MGPTLPTEMLKTVTLHGETYDESRTYLKITTYYAESIVALLHPFTADEVLRGEDKFVPAHAVKACRRTRGINPLILKLEAK